mmetsp:Transcript_1449/g.2058  ORF Transcript_1449/g.2058 Transcript_1449/m.2058 type:complete len:112 (+) Transcript_1449:83-418(+)|eukprot:CAMPEP_0167749222 /NCGR_PEP_ID=MMETSP0110_2-20121227/5280_1 /TAXON_ID=629695 /ORGANISM="Gymnochlora sp., Strain CCMP2014" /LENGTH=111 /DNA_ID=CAMNT_0007634337 /DNA_START=38 /DNA_END=373 /DNA_ORIENTATION=-
MLPARRLLLVGRRSGIVRKFCQEANKVIIPPTTPPKKPAGSTFMQRFGAFMAGVAITATMGYVTLRKDIYEASEGVEKNIQSLHQDIILSTNDMATKLKALEGRIAELEKK